MYIPNQIQFLTQPSSSAVLGFENKPMNTHTKPNCITIPSSLHQYQGNQEVFKGGEEYERIKRYLNNQLSESVCFPTLFTSNVSSSSSSGNGGVGVEQQQYQGNALTSLLKHQLKQSNDERRPSTTTMNEILKMVMMAAPLGSQHEKESVVIDKLGSYAGMINPSQHDSQVISDFNDLKSRSQVLEREMKQITEMSSSQDRSSLKDSVLSVLYQIIDEVLSDTTSSLPLCWSTSGSCKGDNSEQLIKTLSLKWKNDHQQQHKPECSSTNNTMQQHLYQYLSKHSFLTNQELIDLMVNSHNLLEESSTTNLSDSQSSLTALNQSTSQNLLQMETTNTTTEEEMYSLFPSAEDFNMVFKSLGESTNASLIISLDNSMDDTKLSSSTTGESLASSTSPISLSPITIVTPNTSTTNTTITSSTSSPSQTLYNIHESNNNQQYSKKSPTRSTSKSNVDKNQLFGSFLLKTSSSFDTTKISKTRKSSRSAPAQLTDKNKLEADFSRGFLNWNWKEQPKRAKTPNHHEPEIM